jgi:hypothetical protein
VRIAGADPIDPLGAVIYATGISTAPNPPNATPTPPQTEYLSLAGFAIDSNSFTIPTGNPSGYSGIFQVLTQNNYISGNALAYKEVTGASDDPGTFGPTVSEGWVAFTLALIGVQEEPPVEPGDATVNVGAGDVRWDGPGTEAEPQTIVYIMPGDWAEEYVEPPPEPPVEPPEPPEEVWPPGQVVGSSEWAMLLVHRSQSESGGPTFTEIAPLYFTTLTWTRTLNAEDVLTAAISVASIPTEARSLLLNQAATPLEIWVYRNGRPMFAGPLVPGVLQGPTWTLNARGVLWYLRGMIVTADHRYEGEDQHYIARALIDNHQVKPWHHFGIATHTVAASGILRDRTYPAAEMGRVDELIRNLGAVDNGFDHGIVLIQSGGTLVRHFTCWYPRRGRDLADSIILDAQAITDSGLAFGIGSEDIASVAVVYADSETGVPVMGTATNQTLLETWGGWYATEVAQGVTNFNTAIDHAQALLEARQGNAFAVGPNLRSSAEVNPATVEVGDYVTYDFDAGLGPQQLVGRLVRIATSLSAAGESMRVEVA